MKSIYLFTLILLVTQYSCSQTSFKSKPVWKNYSDIQALSAQDSVNQNARRSITLCNTDFQSVHLIQLNDSSYYGYYRSIVRIYIEKTSEYNRYSKYITKTTVIPPATVKMLLDSLEILNIEQLPDSKDIKGYVGYDTGLDGLVYRFYIKTTTADRSIKFWCPEDDYYQNPAIKEIQQVRRILQLLKRQLNLDDEFKLFRKELPNGTYGYGNVIFVKQ